jgi:putative DNA primase/helicase
MWDQAIPAPEDHPYLQLKGIHPHGLRVDDESRLIVPVMIDGALSSLQFIDASGGKQFLPGGKVKGGLFTMGALSHPDMLLLCEGFATGASLTRPQEPGSGGVLRW